jgi:S-adenosylmethionine-diacylgycerolhomoserine-N-methlytransferase
VSGADDSTAQQRMDRLYRFQRHAYDLTRRHFLLGRERVIAALDPPAGGSVLEIACGTAWNLIRAAEMHPSVRLFGLDVSPRMLATARRSVQRSRLDQRIALAQADATCFDAHELFGVRLFDRVLVSYALSIIPRWRSVLAAAERALSGEGSIHIVDFGQCEALPAGFRRALAGWLARFSVTPVAGLEAEIEAFANAKGLDSRYLRWYRGYAAYGVLSRAK